MKFVEELPRTSYTRNTYRIDEYDETVETLHSRPGQWAELERSEPITDGVERAAWSNRARARLVQALTYRRCSSCRVTTRTVDDVVVVYARHEASA